jgi:anti-sigma factor RsiW
MRERVPALRLLLLNRILVRAEHGALHGPRHQTHEQSGKRQVAPRIAQFGRAFRAAARIASACRLNALGRTCALLSVASPMDETDDVEEKKARGPEQEGER